MMECTVLVIDDEPLARKRMISLLQEYSPEIEVLGEAENGEQAIQKIKELVPDAIFLDIQMPDMDAFDVLHALDPDEVPLVIFSTAYSDFAAKAFEENTVDYLMKPVEAERLAIAITKLRKQMPEESNFDVPVPPEFSWEKFRNVVDLSSFYLQRLQVKKGNRVIFVNIDEVVRFHSQDKSTVVYTINNEQHIVDIPLVKLERRLDPKHFVRVHRASIVAIDYIAEYKKSDEGRVTIRLHDKNSTELLVSRALVKRLRDL